MTLSSRFILAFSMSALVHVGFLVLYIDRKNQPPKIVLGEQSENISLALSMFKPVASTATIAKPKTVVKKTKSVAKSVSPPIEQLKPLSQKTILQELAAQEARVEDPVAELDDLIEEQQPEELDVLEQEPVQASQVSEPILNTEPVYYSQASPRYPRKALARGQQGTVLLMLMVDRQGYVFEVEVLESSGVGSLDRAAKKAVKSWRLQPAENNGVAVVSRVKVPVKFNLRS